MPIVDIHLIAGRSQAQLKGLVEDVTAAVVKNTGPQRNMFTLS